MYIHVVGTDYSGKSTFIKDLEQQFKNFHQYNSNEMQQLSHKILNDVKSRNGV